jgi:hypothetical protein
MIDEDDLPEWVEEELNKLTPEARTAVGLDRKSPSGADEAAPKPAVQPKAAAPKPRSGSSKRANTWS